MNQRTEPVVARAVWYDHPGGPEVLRVAEIAVPVAGAGEVVVRVRAAGINPFDAKVRSGCIPMPGAFPRRIGSDFAGTVIGVGSDARYGDGANVRLGDEVFGYGAGAVATHIAVAGSHVARRPEGLPTEAAGSLHVPGLTALSVLATVPVTAHDVVLIGGASGAVGFLAAQLAIAAGAAVIATAHERNHDLLRQIGAMPVAYGEGVADRVCEVLNEQCAGGEVTAVFDCHGRDALDAGVTLGVPVDRMVAIAAYDALEELGVQNVVRDAHTMQHLAVLADQVAAGTLRFPIAARYALNDVVAAYELLERSHAPGKIVVTP